MQSQPQTHYSPVIVGDHYELAETVALQYSGKHPEDLLAKAELSTALLPMSGYKKTQNTDEIGKLPHSDGTAPSESPLSPSGDPAMRECD